MLRDPFDLRSVKNKIDGIRRLNAMTDRRDVVEHYQMWAAAHPDKAPLIPSYFGRAPYNLIPVRLTAQATITVPTGQALTVLTSPFFKDAGTNRPIIAGYVLGAVASNQSTTVPTTILPPARPGEIVPTDGSDANMIGSGAYQVEVIRSSALDEWPTITSDAFANCGSSIQPTSAMDFGIDEHQFINNFTNIDSALGTAVNSSLGNEMPQAPRSTGRFAMCTAPPALRGDGSWAIQHVVDAAGYNYAQWLAYRGGHPYISVTNNAANSIKVVVRCLRWYYVVPEEKFLAFTTAETMRETPHQLPAKILAAGSACGFGNSLPEAHLSATSFALNHRQLTDLHPNVQQKMLVDATATQAITPGGSTTPDRKSVV